MSAIALTLGSPRARERRDVGHHSRDSICPRFANSLRPERKRAQGKPGARCTRGLVCKLCIKKTHTSIQVQRRQSGLPCAMALRLIPCSLPGDRACLPPSPTNCFVDLTPASGRQDHTASPYASASYVRAQKRATTLPRPPHPAPNVRDVRETPL